MMTIEKYYVDGMKFSHTDIIGNRCEDLSVRHRLASPHRCVPFKRKFLINNVAELHILFSKNLIYIMLQMNDFHRLGIRSSRNIGPG